jgi:hypothetical protein
MDDHRAYIDSLPVLRMNWSAFKSLSDYSASLPTGTKPGKMWRRLDGDFDLEWKRRGGQPRWMIGQYDPECPDDADSIRVFWYRPIITMRAEVPHVRLTPSMWVPARYGSVDQKLRDDIAEWLNQRGRHIVLRFTHDRIEFHRRDDAFEFRMRWS